MGRLASPKTISEQLDFERGDAGRKFLGASYTRMGIGRCDVFDPQGVGHWRGPVISSD